VAQINPNLNVPDTLRMDFYEGNDLTPGLYEMPKETIYWRNGFLHCGLTVDTVSGYSGIVLIHLDTLGNTIWKKKHFSPTHWAFQPTRMIVVYDTSIYITGIVNADGVGDYDMFLARFNETGIMRHVKFYQQPGMQWAHDIVQAPNNSLWFLSSHRNDYYDDSSRYRIWRINEIGDTLQTYISSLKMKYALRIQPKNEKIFIGGDVKSHPGRNYTINAFVDVVDTSLSLEKEIAVHTALNDRFYQFIYWQGDLHVGTVITDFDPANHNRGYGRFKLGKIDKYGYYPKNAFTPFCEYGYFGGAFVISDTLLGLVHYRCENFPLLRLYNENLQPVKERGYWLGDPNTDFHFSYPFVSFVTPSKKLGGSGYHSPGSATDDYDHMFFLTESVYSMLKRVNRVDETPPPLYNKQQLVYPNPFTDVLNISVPAPFAGGEVSIYNSLGEEIFRDIPWYSLTIDTRLWQAGIYMVAFTLHGKIEMHKVVKVN
jgi:hypothetical protein